MKQVRKAHTASNSFDTVRAVGLALPGVEATIKKDGSPVLKVGGSFMAGLATHRSAEPDTLVVRAGFEERQWLMDEVPRPTTRPTTINAIPWCSCGCRESITSHFATCCPCHGAHVAKMRKRPAAEVFR
jgi:hypothetical protein